MTEIKLEPIKQIVIQELIHENFENLMHYYIACQASWAIWVDGIIIDVVRYDSDEEEFKKALDGIEVFKRITFVKFPKYTKMIKWDSVGMYEIPMINHSNSQKSSTLAKWIKTQPIWNQAPKHEELNLQIQEKYR